MFERKSSGQNQSLICSSSTNSRRTLPLLIALRLEDSHSNLRGYSKVARRKIAELGGVTSLAAFPIIDETNMDLSESSLH